MIFIRIVYILTISIHIVYILTISTHIVSILMISILLISIHILPIKHAYPITFCIFFIAQEFTQSISLSVSESQGQQVLTKTHFTTLLLGPDIGVTHANLQWSNFITLLGSK